MINMRKKMAYLLSMIMLFSTILSGTGMTLVIDAKGTNDADNIKIVLEDDSVSTENVVENLEGTIEGVKEIENVTYQVYSENNKVVTEGNAKVKDNKFVAEDVKLQDGENKVIFTAEDIQGNTTTEEMKVTYDAGKLAKIPKKNLIEDESGEIYVNNTLLIYFHLNVSEERREEIIKSINGTVIGQMNAIKCYQVQIKESSLKELKKISKQLMKDYPGEVMSAKYDFVQNAQIYVPDDPFDDGEDWTEESPEGNNWGFEAVQMASAWEKAEEFLDLDTGRFKNVKTGIVDNGFDMSHEDLGHVTTHLFFSSENISQDHGSHTSGIVGAQWNNGKGIAGICQSDMVLISAINDSGNLLSSNLTKGLVDAVTNGAKTINYSIGSVYPLTADGADTANIIASLYVQGYDFIYVQSAGNSSYDAIYNGSFCSITEKVAKDCADSYGITANDILKRRMVVAAVGQDQKKNYEIAKFSNYGKQVDICAPGVDIYSLVSDGKYAKMSGTSMAAPFVTGIAALVWAVNDDLTGPEVRDIICDSSNSTVTVTDRDNNKINMINAKLCVEAAYERGFHIDNYAVGDGTEKTYTVGDSIELSVSAANSVKYTYEVRDEGTDEVVYVKENTAEENITWVPAEVGEYKIVFYAYDENGTCAHKMVENIKIVSEDSTPLEITAFSVSKEQASVAEDVELSVEIEGGTAPYTYRFGTIFNGKTYYSNGAYITEDADGSFYETNKIIFQPRKLFGTEDSADAIGVHTLFVEVKDSNGKVKSKKIRNYKVNGLEVKDIKTSLEAPQTVGTSIELMAVVENDGLKIGGVEEFSISKKGGTEEVLAIQSDGHSAVWTPEESGYYTVTYHITDALGQQAEKSIMYRVKKEAANETVIYYKGYDTPYIHYKVGNGSWTTLPGVPMEATNVMVGYSYKAVIPLGTEEECTVCFNDGNGNWDSNNGQNYIFAAGTYGYKNGVQETFENGLKLEYSLSNYGKYNVNAFSSVYGGKAPYTFEYKCYSAEGTEYGVRQYEEEKYIERSSAWISVDRAGTYYLTVTVTDSDGNQISETKSCSLASYSFSFTTDVASPQKVGTSIHLTAQIENMPIASRYEYTTYYILKDGQIIGSLPYNCSNDNTWTPTEAGDYTIFAYLRDAAGDVGTYFMDYEIKDEINNQTTIYYKGYNTPYIHYKVDNGEWTTVPGKPMEKSNEIAGYTHKYTIDLGEEKGVTVCFNDGNGNWDSDNERNYYFGVGTYGYADGKYSEITSPTVGPTPTATPVSGKKSVLYYANDNWSQAYVHYKVGNGEWTTVPGVKMETSNEQSGYTWKYTIDLGNESEATVCFNNGSGAWDSRNEANYLIYEGEYGIKNQQVTELSQAKTKLYVKEFTVSDQSPISIIDARNITLSAVAENGSGDYSYQFGSILNGKEYYMTDGYQSSESVTVDFWTFMSSTYEMTAKAVGTHTLFVDVKDNNDGSIARATISDYKVEGLEITNFSADAASPQLVGTSIKLSAVVKNEATYRYNTYEFYVIKDGIKTRLNPWYTGINYTMSWTPTEAGDYTLQYYIRDNIGQEATATLDYKIVNTMNLATVYYANSEWDNAYIHYKIGNGEWTTIPGVKMSTSSEQSGYTWKYIIDLGSESNATICFNDGNDSWDSKYGANYIVTVGNTGIKNGIVTKLGEVGMIYDMKEQQSTKLDSVSTEDLVAGSSLNLGDIESGMTLAESIGKAYQYFGYISSEKVSQN